MQAHALARGRPSPAYSLRAPVSLFCISLLHLALHSPCSLSQPGKPAAAAAAPSTGVLANGGARKPSAADQEPASEAGKGKGKKGRGSAATAAAATVDEKALKVCM